MDVGHPDEINELFDTISYEKGCSLIRMMNVFLTEEVFNTGINDYLNTYAYGNAFQVLNCLVAELSLPATRLLFVPCAFSSFPWCSGYHIRLTRGRSPVRSRAETYFWGAANSAKNLVFL